MASRIKIRKDTAAQWTAINPVLANGEMGIELGNPPRAKIGNGVLTWNLLGYIEGPTGLTGLTGVVGERGATGAQGAAGINGTPGTHGTNATYILAGNQPPTASVGKTGDFFVDRVSKVLWGPKQVGGWPASGKSIAPSTTPVGNANINTGTGAPIGADGSPWPSPWITTETSSSGIQDWNSGKLRLVSPSAGGESSSAYANLTKSNIFIKYNFSLSSVVDANAQFLFRASSNLNVGFALNYNPATSTIDFIQKSNSIETVLFTSAFNFVADQSITTDIYLIGNRMLAKTYPSGQVQPTVLTFDFDVSSALYNDQTRVAFKITGNAKTMYLSSFISSEVPVGIEPTPTITLSQNFNSVTSAAAAGFVATAGSFAIASQGLRSNVASNSIGYYSYDLSSNNTFVQAKFIFGTSGTNVTAGLNGRVSSNKNSYYRFTTSAGLGTVKLSYVSNGVVTDIDSYVANIQPNTEHVFRLECQNTSIRCYINNQIVISYNEATPGTTINPFTGITINPGAFTSNVTIDDYLIGTLSGTVVEGNSTLFTQDFNAVFTPNPTNDNKLPSRIMGGYYETGPVFPNNVPPTEMDDAYNVFFCAFATIGADGTATFSIAGNTIPKPQLIAYFAQVRAEGRPVIVSIGGWAGALSGLSSLAHQNQFFNTITPIIDEYGFDGLDWDLEHVDGSASDIPDGISVTGLASVSRRLKAKYGSRFLITMAPAVMNVTEYQQLAANLHATGELDLVMFQFYNMSYVATPAQIVTIIGEWIAAIGNGFTANKFIMGMMYTVGNFDSINYSQMVAWFNAVRIEYPTIRGVMLWSLQDGDLERNWEFANTFRPLVNPDLGSGIGNGVGVSTGQFHVNPEGSIVDPNGRFFIPTGGCTVSQPTGLNVNDSVWGTTSGAHSYANGNAWRAKAAGWNCTEITVPIPTAINGTTANIFTENFDGRGQTISNGTFVTSTNSFARIDQNIPPTGYVDWNGNYYTGLNQDGMPRFSTVSKTGTYSMRAGLVSQGEGVFGGSFYHYSMDTVEPIVYFDWWYRFDNVTAQAAQNGSTPGLWLARPNWSNFDTQTPRLSLDRNLNLSQGGAWGAYSMSPNTWYKMSSVINCPANKITTTIRDANGNWLDAIESNTGGVWGVGFIEFGALWCNMQHFTTTGYTYWDDVQMSTQPIGVGSSDPFTLQQSLEGLAQALDEWTAAGIVCIVTPTSAAIRGSNPTSWNASSLDSVRNIHNYVIANYKNNQYVWLETLGESFGPAGSDGSGQWTNWSNVSAACFNDAIAQGWNNMQVFLMAGYGDGIDVMANSTLYDNWFTARASTKLAFGWHNFGTETTLELMRSKTAAVKAKNIPLIITAFGQNWNDGLTGFGRTNTSEVFAVDFVRDYGAQAGYRTGGLAWQATGRHSTVTTTAIANGPWPGNYYSLRYCRNNARFRPWYDEGEALNEVGQLIATRGALGYSVIGGGPIEANGGGQSGGTNTATGSFLDYGFSYLTTSTPTAFTVTNGVVKVTANTTTPSAEAYATKDMASSDHWVEADVIVGSSTSNQFAGVIARVKTTAPYSYYKFEVADSSSQLKLSAFINGAEVRAWYAPYTLIPNTSVRLRMECVGTNTRCFANGTKVLDVVHEPDTNVPGNGGITSTANIAVETYEGKSQPITDGTLITSNNSIARVDAAIPATAFYVFDAPDQFNSQPNNEVLPQFDTAQKKNGTYSARFALERPPSFPTSWGASYFHYSIQNPAPVLYLNFWWRMDAAMANGITAGSEPNLIHVRSSFGGTQLTYLRVNTNRQLVWHRSVANTRSTGGIQYQINTWYKIETTMDAVAGTSRVIVKNEAGTILQDSSHVFDSVSSIGFAEWGAAWCSLANFAVRGHMWFDDVELSSAPIGVSAPSNTVPGTIIANTTKVGLNMGRASNAISTVSIDNFKAGNFVAGGGGGTPPPTPGAGEANSITQPFNTGATSSSVGFANFRGDFVVSGGVVKAATVNQDFDSYHTTTLTLSDHFVEADFIFGAADPSGSYFGVNARMSRTQQTWYGVEIEGNPGTLQLIKFINGIATLLGTWTTGWTANSTHKIRLECFGSSIKVYADTASVISVIDTSITGNVNVGIHGYAGSNVNSVTVDNFYAQIITGGSNPGTSVTIAEAFNSDPIPFTTRLNAGGFERGAGGVLSVTAATGTDHEAYHNTDIGSSDHWVEVDIVRGTTTTTTPGGGGSGASQATTARFFYGGTGVYNTLIADWDVQVHPRSAAIVQTLANGTNDRGLTTEAFGTSIVDYDPNGETYQLIIMNDSIYGGAYGGSGQWGFNNATYLYPTVKLQPGFQWPSGTDGAFAIRDWANDRCINLWIPSYDAANRRILAHWGGVFPANSDGNSMYPNYSPGPYQQTQQQNRSTGTGAVYGHTAIGVSAMQGMLLFDDLQRGVINHALNFATRMIAGPPQSPGTAFFYPATTNDGSEYGPDRVEAGARFQLTASDATINAISHPGQRMMARCLKDYGAFISDFAGAMMTYGSQRPKAGVPSEAALYTNYGWSLAGDGWNPMNEIPWSQARILIPGPNAPFMTQSSATVFNPTPITTTTPVTDPLGSIFGVHARMSTSTKTSYSAVSANGGAVMLYKHINGVSTQLGSWTTGWAVAGNHKIRLQCVGTTIKVFADGVEVISVTDSSIITGTRVGVRGAAGSVKGAILLDNFAAQSLGSTNTTTPAPSGTGGGATPPTGSILSDTFDSLLNFTIIDGAAQLVSGRLGVTSLNADTIAQHKTDMGVVNHYVEADCVIGSADTGTYWAVLARMSATGRSFYAAETVGDRQRVAIVKVINGVKSSLGEYITGWPLNSTRKIGLQVNGSTITLYTDGAARLTVTDNALTAETLVGIRIMSSSSTSAMLFDNFRATTLSSTPSTGGNTSGGGGTTTPPPSGGGGTTTPPPTGGGGTTPPPPPPPPPPTGGGGTNVNQGFFSTSFNADGGASANGMADTPPNGLHEYNVPLVVSGGVAYPRDWAQGYGDCVAFPAQNDINTNQYAKALIHIDWSGRAGAYTGVMVRVNPTSGTGWGIFDYSWYKFEMTGYGTIRCTKVIDHTPIDIWSGNWTLNANTTYEFYLEIIGNTLKGKIDGVELFTVNDFDITTGKPGITLYNETGQQQTTIEYFEAGSL